MTRRHNGQASSTLGRPWITLLIDRYSGYLLGFYISFYGPSSATVARAIKVSIMRDSCRILTRVSSPLARATQGLDCGIL